MGKVATNKSLLQQAVNVFILLLNWPDPSGQSRNGCLHFLAHVLVFHVHFSDVKVAACCVQKRKVKPVKTRLWTFHCSFISIHSMNPRRARMREFIHDALLNHTPDKASCFLSALSCLSVCVSVCVCVHDVST